MERRKGGQIPSHFVCVLFHFQNFSKAKIDLGKTRSFVKYLDSHGTPADVQFLFFLVESLDIQVKLEDPLENTYYGLKEMCYQLQGNALEVTYEVAEPAWVALATRVVLPLMRGS